jgi:tetratricopeptide (TPR) repeat protein
MARALRGNGPYGPNGLFAEATLLVLLGRQEEAFAALEKLSVNPTAAEEAWVNVLYMYTTGDWRRPGSDPESLLERLQRFGALVGTLGSTAAVERMGEQVHGEPADWGRIVTSQFGGAASDRPFIESQMGKEIAELQEVRTLTHGRPLPPDRLADALNESPSRCLTADGPRVIAWGTWAAFYQRHICGLISAAEEHLRGALGMPEWAETYGQRADSLFQSLTLYPIVEVRRTRKVGGRVEDTIGMSATIALTRRRPELVNVFNWEYMADTAGHMMIRRGMPRADTWFSRAVLVSTAFDTQSRFRVLRTTIDEQEVVAALRRTAPRHVAVRYLALDHRKPEELNVEELAKEFGERVDYDLFALHRIRQAAGDDREDAVPILEKMCDIDANECTGLGWILYRAGRHEEAAAAFERAVADAPDRIHVCNNCGWLVNYYFDKGQKDKALRVAEMVAEVYCYEGLRTMAELQERLGHMGRAEEFYVRIAERYDSEKPVSYPLLAFYYRMVRDGRTKQYEQRFQRLLRPIFPESLEPLPHEHEVEPPKDGLLIDGVSKRLTDSGLRGADVIVGLNGFRVRSLEQYDAILWFRQRTWDMNLRVWRQSQYLDIQPHVPFLHFGVRVRTFGTPGPSFEHR